MTLSRRISSQTGYTEGLAKQETVHLGHICTTFDGPAFPFKLGRTVGLGLSSVLTIAGLVKHYNQFTVG